MTTEQMYPAPAPAPAPAQQPKKKRRWLYVAGAAVAAIWAISALSGGNTADADEAKPSSSQSQTAPDQKATEAKPTPELTTAQEQAIGSAKDYLEFQPFSKAGLIEQLSSKAGEGFDRKDAVFAVNHIDVDWNHQAYLSAKSYLEFQHFSRAGLIEQLSSPAGEGFTHAQAVYGVNKVGL
jgi:hypothetical protein